MTDVLTNIFEWLIPSGSLGAVIAWIVSSRIRNAKTAKEVHDTYKAMYEDVQGHLIELRNENEKLHKAVLRLERTIHSATLCTYRRNCPVLAGMQNDATCTHSKRGKKPVGQPGIGDLDDSGDTDTGADGDAIHPNQEPA